jgi:hypothetical protein
MRLGAPSRLMIRIGYGTPIARARTLSGRDGDQQSEDDRLEITHGAGGETRSGGRAGPYWRGGEPRRASRRARSERVAPTTAAVTRRPQKTP